jgi:hypothetical protein
MYFYLTVLRVEKHKIKVLHLGRAFLLAGALQSPEAA